VGLNRFILFAGIAIGFAVKFLLVTLQIAENAKLRQL